MKNIYNYQKRLERVEKNIKNSLIEENIKTLERFKIERFAKNIQIATIIKNLTLLKCTLKTINKETNQINRDDLILYFSKLNQMVSKVPPNRKKLMILLINKPRFQLKGLS